MLMILFFMRKGENMSTIQNAQNIYENGSHDGKVRVVDASELLESYETAERYTEIEEAVRTILTSVGEDPDREGLERTPHRVAKMYDELLAGYQVNLDELINDALFDVDYDEMIVVKDIEFFSMCEHHMLPFYGRAHVAYIPRNKIIGLSKIPRIVEMFARRLQVQERMTRQIADTINETLDPLGVAVVIEGSHMCSMMRGVKKEHPRMVTSTMLGSFKANPMTRNEFMDHLRGRGNTL
jgi:GTP cyclohydrolase I